MKLRLLISLSTIISILLIFSGCNDSPDQVGTRTQPNSDFGAIQVDTFYATNHSSNYNRLSTLSYDRFMIGKYQTYQAWACLKFLTWPDTMLKVTITSAYIRLKSAYHFGPSMAALPIDIYRARSVWTGDSLTYDSLYLNTSAQAPYYYYYDVNSRYSATLQAGDTDWVTLNIPDTSMLREWFSTNYDTLQANEGLIFIPNSSSNVIRGFYSSSSSDTSYVPTLYISYIGDNGPNTYEHKLSSSKFVSTVDRSSLITDPKLIYVQNGISYRGLISFDSILTQWPVPVHRAVLQVTLNKSKSTSVSGIYPTPFYTDSLFAASVGTDSIVDGRFISLSQVSTDNFGNTVYSFEAANLVNYWLNNLSARKVSISGYSEGESFDLFTLYGEAYEKNLKPRIIITYSVKK